MGGSGSGGGRARSGPPPNPNALRRDRRGDAEWTVLPATAPDEPAPEWPLSEQTPREARLWSKLWRKPQSLLWRRNEQDLQVAMYARCLAEAEKPEATTSLRNLVRQQGDALLLSLPAMHAARVRIDDGPDSGATSSTKATAAAASGESVRARMKAIDSGGA